MKPFFSKTLDVLTFGTLRRRRGGTTNSTDWGDTQYALTQSLPVVPSSSVQVIDPKMSIEVGGETGSWSIYEHAASPPPEYLDATEDDVIFCKNNVYLKYMTTSTNGSDHASNYENSTEHDMGGSSFIPLKPLLEEGGASSRTSSNSSRSLDEVHLVPGYMNLCTRGSDFGQTLILNWTPNHHMTRNSDLPLGDLSESPKDPAESVENGRKEEQKRLDISPLSLNLGQMESIHIFYQSDTPTSGITSGELVLSSRERKLTMFCFKHQGLFDLLKKFRSWQYFSYKHYPEAKEYIFSVTRPRLTLSELHLEEGLVTGVLTESMWSQLQDPVGRILDKKLVLQTVFFRGMDLSLRNQVWLLLLGVIEFDSTAKERESLYHERQSTYIQIDTKREKLMSSDEAPTDQSVFQQITNDIKRTDRSHSFYKGDDNNNIHRLETILLNYLLIYRPDITYCQGMTDILAPVLMSLNNDAEAFFCFTHLVERSPFFTKAGKRVTLHRQVAMLKALIALLLPWFYQYLLEVEDGLSFLFVHRWLLVSFKREFKMEDTLHIWEVCWTNYSTNSFHLFICVAIIAVYGQQALDQEMNINELTVHFNGLANSMPVDVILSQARGYLYQFTKCLEVPCVLRPIMSHDYWETSRGLRISCEGSGLCCKGGVI